VPSIALQGHGKLCWAWRERAEGSCAGLGGRERWREANLGRPLSLPDLPTHWSGRLCGQMLRAQHSRHCQVHTLMCHPTHPPPLSTYPTHVSFTHVRHAHVCHAHWETHAAPRTFDKRTRARARAGEEGDGSGPGVFGAGAHTGGALHSPYTNPCSCRAETRGTQRIEHEHSDNQEHSDKSFLTATCLTPHATRPGTARVWRA
jgi:hypothetical protein